MSEYKKYKSPEDEILEFFSTILDKNFNELNLENIHYFDLQNINFSNILNKEKLVTSASFWGYINHVIQIINPIEINTIYQKFYDQFFNSSSTYATEEIKEAYDMMVSNHHDQALELLLQITNKDRKNYLAWLGIVECTAFQVRDISRSSKYKISRSKPFGIHSAVYHESYPIYRSYWSIGSNSERVEYAASRAIYHCQYDIKWLVEKRINDLVYESKKQLDQFLIKEKKNR